MTAARKVQADGADKERLSSNGETPTSEEVVTSVEKSFEENIKPVWAEWDKDVRTITYGCVAR